MGHFADLCPPRSQCSATCGTLFAVYYDVYTIGAGGHPPRFAIASRGIEVSISKVSTFLTFADLCPPRSRCSATCGTPFALHYDVYTIGSGGHPPRLSLQYAGVPLRGVQSQLILTALSVESGCGCVASDTLLLAIYRCSRAFLCVVYPCVCFVLYVNTSCMSPFSSCCCCCSCSCSCSCSCCCSLVLSRPAVQVNVALRVSCMFLLVVDFADSPCFLCRIGYPIVS